MKIKRKVSRTISFKIIDMYQNEFLGGFNKAKTVCFRLGVIKEKMMTLKNTPEGLSGTPKVACSDCNLRELCMPVGLNVADMQKLDAVVATRKRVAQGETLFSCGELFTSIFAVRTGFFKTCVSSEDGREQVTGFQMAGEIIGEYTGVIMKYGSSMNYSWMYPSSLPGYENLQINGNNAGNLLRFVNDLENHNCYIAYVPDDNKWKLFYLFLCRTLGVK